MLLPPSCRHILRSRYLRGTSPKRINARRFSSPTNIIHPAIISGGGPTGLFLSNLLTSYSIPHLLFDKRPQDELMKHPQAHFINLRSMELLRHEMPSVYTKVVEGMPSVSEWEAFHFGGSVIGGKRLGRVFHPVSESLKIGQTGSALLVTESNSVPKDPDANLDKANIVSPCKPAHLAQNKFVSLLLDEARRTTDGGNHIHYNEEIIKITEQIATSNSKNPIITIHTPQNTYQTRYLLACDGVHSFARKHCQIPMKGDSALQHMMNIHFRTNSALSELLMAQLEDQAMLHFVYNQSLIGAFVCHDGHEGEWVLQVPYFPPYQVPEVDFKPDIVKEMIWSGLLGGISRNKDYSFDILSVRSWTMSSQVAERYMNEHQNIILVGDAAHSFPPAGGFGMNTGLQDAHNLAWRLALNLHRKEDSNAIGDDSDVELLRPSCKNSIMSMYEHDRKPIAIQNAALSVRNYKRTLKIAKACYLDAQHPQILMSLLGSPPMSFLPLETKQGMFRQLLKVAMLPLSSLTEDGNSIHANHVTKNVQKILEKGGSLPLVFPRYELGFSYTKDGDQVSRENNDDSAGYNPSIRVGHRLPHVEMKLLGQINGEWNVLEATHSNLLHGSIHGNDVYLSLCDISSQMRCWHSVSSPIFSLLTLGTDLAKSTDIIQQVTNENMNKREVSLATIHVIRHKSDWSTIHKTNAVQTQHCGDGFQVNYLLDVNDQLHQIAQKDLSPDTDTDLNAFVLVRPDGHIANATSRDLNIDLHEQLSIFIERGLSNSLGSV